MARAETEREMIAQFDNAYRHASAPVVQAIERRVCGCAYGGTSWTTRDEAERMGEVLALAPGKRLLEIGAGAGWPGLHLAKTTGCTVVLVDLPAGGLRVACERARDDGLAGRCFAAQADAAALPLQTASFDAISHSDVLCCLPDKAGVLRECRRAIRDAGRMAFTVIFIAENLSHEDHAEALATGPSFIETPLAYEDMLTQAGWRIVNSIDLTAAFATTMKTMIEARAAHAGELTHLMGAAETEDTSALMRRKLPAIERGLLRRAMFVAEPA